MVRVLLDTNVLISALISEGKPRTLLRLAYKKRYRLILSKEILGEFIGVIGRERFREYVGEEDVERF